MIRYECIRFECLRCGHPVELHDHIGCTWIDDPNSHDYCPCPLTDRELKED